VAPHEFEQLVLQLDASEHSRGSLQNIGIER
jgi:hypothetical protein